MIAIDTNILVYARDPRDARKQAIAASLIASEGDFVLLWQVACEFIAASRKLPWHRLVVKEEAWRDVIALAKVWPLRNAFA